MDTNGLTRTAPAHAQTKESHRGGIDAGEEECGAAGSAQSDTYPCSDTPAAPPPQSSGWSHPRSRPVA
eukprot:174272-Prymnesium_polylepis.1